MYSDSVAILPHGSHADVIFEYKSKIYKVQVKTTSKKTRVISKHTRKAYRSKYKVEFRRGSHTKNRAYKKGQIDIFAVVIHPKNKVIFIPANTRKNSYRFSDKDIIEISTGKSLKDSIQQILNTDPGSANV